MQALNLPTYSFNIKSEGGRTIIFDVIRRKYVALTPEEWVRQNFIHYLNIEKKYPLTLMSVETGFALYETNKRSDILIHNRQGKATALVECKAPEVKITRTVFEQIVRYNLKYELNILMVTNGLKHYCSRVNHLEHATEFLKEIPDYDNLILG
jgi:hypothetical protein